VRHSRSPLLHGFWIRETGVDGAYLPLPVEPTHLEQALRALPILGFRGCNLTIPHKRAALSLIDYVEPTARRIGAVNTVVVRPDGSLEGRNTDAYGFRENLREGISHWDPAAGPAVVLGAGGAARAIVAALGETGVAEVRIVNRTFARAEKVARDLSTPETTIDIFSWDEVNAAQRHAALLVNATSLGMVGEPPLTLDLSSLPPSAPVVDAVYTPLETGLLAAARQRGNPAVDGLGMLLHQGRPAFEAWFEVTVRVTRGLRAATLAGLVPAR